MPWLRSRVERASGLTTWSLEWREGGRGGKVRARNLGPVSEKEAQFELAAMNAGKRTRQAKQAVSPERAVPAAERARDSGFHTKLDAWLSANSEARGEGAVHYGPHSAERLAKVLTAQGESVNPGTVLRWRTGQVLPESRYVALLERLLGAPWTYLDDPKTPWPRPATREAVVELLSLLPDDEVADLARSLRQALARRDGQAKSR